MAALNPSEKNRIAQALEERRASLLTEIRSELERAGHQHFADLAGEVADAGDASVADMLVDQDIAVVRRQVEELTMIEQAQKRFSAEHFGSCDECGSDIGFGRLTVVPYATRCIACQTLHEKMYAHEATPKM